MTVNSFYVENASELNALLARVSGLTIGDREWAHESTTVFLEEYQLSNPDCCVDFTKRSLTGPGYSEPKSRTVDFHMSPGAGFAQQTAAILRGEYMAVQYNHYGVRHSAITAYLSSVLDTDTRVLITPMIRKDVFDRFTGSSKHGRLTFAVNTRVPIHDLADDDVALSAALRMAAEVEAGVVTIDLSYGTGKKGGPLHIVDTVRRLLRRKDCLSKLQVSAEREDGTMAMLNLLNNLARRDISSRRLELTRWTYGRYT